MILRLGGNLKILPSPDLNCQKRPGGLNQGPVLWGLLRAWFQRQGEHRPHFCSTPLDPKGSEETLPYTATRELMLNGQNSSLQRLFPWIPAGKTLEWLPCWILPARKTTSAVRVIILIKADIY